MEKYNNWKLKFYTIWAGQAVSLITSAHPANGDHFYLTRNQICDSLVYGFTSRFFTLCGLWTSYWCISGSS